MRVLQIINDLSGGGAATVVVETSIELKKRGYDVEILTVYTRGALSKRLVEAGIIIHDLGFAPDIATNTRFNKYDPRIPLKIRNFIKSGRYDIAHVHLFPSVYYVALSSYMVSDKTSLIFTEHSENNRRRQKAWLRPIERLVYSRYRGIIGVGDSTTENLRRWVPAVASRTYTVFNAIDTDRYVRKPQERRTYRANLGVDEETILVMLVGRMTEVKGVDILLDVVPALMSATQRPLAIKIVGSGPLTSVYMQRIEALGISDHVQMLGFREDIPDLLVAADVLALPSRWEGLPMVILEAMAANCAIVASRVGAIPQAINDGEEGLIIAPESHEALRDALRRVIEDDELRMSLGAAARARVQAKFSVQTHVDELIKIYDKVLN